MQEEKTYNESELIKALQAGHISAFDAIFTRHSKRLYVYVMTMIRDRVMAEEIVQDCFIELIRRIDSIKPSMGVGAWLTRVARNRVIDVIRHREYETSKTVSIETYCNTPQIARAVTPRDEVISDEMQQMIQNMLNNLPHSQREILVMRYYSGLKFKEIARILRRPLGTVLWQARKALEKLHGEFKRIRKKENS